MMKKPLLHVIIMLVMLMIIVSINDVMGFKEFQVGGPSHGWTIPNKNETDFFDLWASSKRFHVGDTLLFQYKNDTLLIVDKYGYYHCDPSKATNIYSDGNTIVKLEHPGLIYFISGNVDRCLHGLRMIVDVMSVHHAAAHAPTPLAEPPATIAQAEGPSPLAGTNSGSSHLVITQVPSFLGIFVAVISVFF